jgi:hypothetical protein
MARVHKTWGYKLMPGRIDDARALFKEIKEKTNGDVTLYHADAAGSDAGTLVLGVAYPSATAAGKDHDELYEAGSEGEALWHRVHAADSPVELTYGVVYTEVDL